MIESSDALAKALARKLLKRPHSSTQARLKPYSPNLPRRRKLAFYNNNRSSKARRGKPRPGKRSYFARTKR